MGKDTATARDRNRRIRQDALREQLSKQGHLEQAVELVEKIKNGKEKLESTMIRRYEIALNAHLRLVDKYIPSLKATDIDLTSDGEPIAMPTVIRLVGPGE